MTMRPHKIILTTIGILVCTTIRCQPWIGTLFNWDTAVVLGPGALPSNLSHLRCRVSDGTFYYTDMTSYQQASRNYAAVIHSIRLDNFVTSSILIPLPPTVKQKQEAAGRYWIHDFSIYPDRVVVSTQDQIILYHRGNSDTVTFDTMYQHPNIKAAYIFHDTLHYFEEEHDTGYKWFHRPLCGGQEELVRVLPYEAPHVVQASPNRYLFHDQQHVFFLSTRFPLLHQYGLDGTWIQDFVFDIPDWHPFEEEYIRKSLSVPYGIERIRATMNEIWRYSYPKYDFPIGGGHLLYYTQYDTTTRKSHLQYAYLDPSGNTCLFHKKDTCQDMYGGERFPFLLFESDMDKARISWNDLLLEICAESAVSWTDLTPAEYRLRQEEYFKRNEPIIKIRAMRHKNSRPETQAILYDGERHLLSLQDLPAQKNVFLVTKALSCSACMKFLLGLLNTTDSNHIHIGVYYDFIPGALREREMRKEIRQYLERPFGLYYPACQRSVHNPRRISSIIGFSEEAGLLLYEKGKAPIFYDLDHIFEDDPYTYRLKAGFEQEWIRFTQNQK